MVSLLQSYLQISDAEAVEMTVVDLRFQMVLSRSQRALRGHCANSASA